MKPKRIVLDINVLYAGLYSSSGASYQILKRIEQKQIRTVISTSLLFEYEDVLKRKQSELGFTNQQIEIVLDNICLFSDFQDIYFLWRPYLRDPKDDLVLELAVASHTQWIITYNLKDFKGIDKFGIQSITPKALLEKIT